MRKWPLLAGICIISCFKLLAQDNATLLADLNKSIAEKAMFTKAKQERIESIKATLGAIASPEEKYRLNRLLYLENQKFRIDTSVYYARQNVQIAKSLGREDLIAAASLDLVNAYLPLNRLIEAEALLNGINPKLLTKPALADYYLTKTQFYEHYVTDDDGLYLDQLKKYRDSFQLVIDPSSLDYHVSMASKYMLSGQLKEGEQYLLNVLKTKRVNSPDYAMLTFYLGMNYEKQHNNEKAVRYYAASAAADVRLSIKDNSAMQALALLLYATNDLDHAYQYTQSALEDAWFCDSRFRTIHMSKFYAIINTAYLKKEAARKKQLQLYLVLISLLSIFLAAGVLYVYKHMRRVARMKGELDLKTTQLADLNQVISNSNTRLNEANTQLTEANKVKEAYIAQFFDLCSSYINKLENFSKLVNKKAGDKNMDELQKMLRSPGMVNDEVGELYKIFDSIFLTLYPNFVAEFNALLAPDKKIILKHGELLNTELRIYALIRLGITDSAQIASFLRYSLSTIYNYRTNARNKAIVSRDEFEDMVIKIGSIG